MEKSTRFRGRKSSIMRYLSWFCRRLCSCKCADLEDEQIRDDDGCDIGMNLEEFQQLMNERRAERKREAEEERYRGQRRIADMTSRTGIDPLELFPREIWMKILDKLEPADRANIYRVHDVFTSSLEDTLTRDALVPLLLDHKMPLVQKHLTPRLPYPSRRSLELTHLKTLRCVSKSFRDSVDGWFEDRLLHIMRNSELEDLIYRDIFNSLELNPSVDFDKFNGSPGERPPRFFIRSLKIKFYYDRITFLEEVRFSPEQVSIFKDNVTDFLKKVGDQILHVDLDFGLIRMKRRRAGIIYDWIRKWLLLMPKLKWLQLTDTWVKHKDLWSQTKALPCLPELERFDFDTAYHNSLRICEAVLVANPQVKYFSHRGFEKVTHINLYNDPLVLSLPLESVNLGDYGMTNDEGGIEESCSLEQIYDNNWNLRRIALFMGEEEGEEKYSSLDSIFAFIQRFQTLEKVELHVVYLSIGKEVGYLRLPNLMDFIMEFVNLQYSGDAAFFHSLQFLLYCGKLRSLGWDNLTSTGERYFMQARMRDRGPSNGIMIDFCGGDKNLSASNVWDVFPDLRSIKVTFVHTNEKPVKIWNTFVQEYRDRRLVRGGN